MQLRNISFHVLIFLFGQTSPFSVWSHQGDVTTGHVDSRNKGQRRQKSSLWGPVCSLKSSLSLPVWDLCAQGCLMLAIHSASYGVLCLVFCVISLFFASRHLVLSQIRMQRAILQSQMCAHHTLVPVSSERSKTCMPTVSRGFSAAPFGPIFEGLILLM